MYFGDFPVPVCLTLGLDSLDEMKEFFEVNTNAKSVKTDLAWALLREMAAEDNDLIELLESKDKDWTIRGIDVARELTKLGGPWAGRIQEPNQKKHRGDDLVIPQAQFVRSVKPVLDMAAAQSCRRGDHREHPERVLERDQERDAGAVLGTQRVCDSEGPGGRCVPQVVEVMRAKGKGLADAAGYAEVMLGVARGGRRRGAPLALSALPGPQPDRVDGSQW
jgi:hypothetical protein